MGRKNVIPVYQFLTDGDMSGSITSQSFNVKNLDKASIRLSWVSADAIGEFFIEARQEEAGKPEQSSDWFTLEFGNQILVDVPGNSELEHQILMNELPFVEMRVIYTPTSGSGTVQGKLTAKQIGG